MALTKVNAEGINVADDFAFTGTVSGAGLASPFPTGTAVTSGGGAATTNIAQGLAKAWINQNGGASGAAARDSFNIGSIADNGTGDYTNTFTSNMANDDFAVSENSSRNPAEAGQFSREVQCDAFATTAYTVNSFILNGPSNTVANNTEFIYTVVHGDLA